MGTVGANEIVGAVALIIGAIFVVIGLGGAWRESQRPPAIRQQGLEDISKLIEQVTRLIEALTKAQFWLASTFVGGFFIAYGTWVLQREPF